MDDDNGVKGSGVGSDMQGQTLCERVNNNIRIRRYLVRTGITEILMLCRSI